MKKIILAASMLTVLNLSDNSTDDDANNAIQDLVDKAKKTDGLIQDLADVNLQMDTLKKATTTKEVADLLDKGVADKKLTVELSEKLKLSFSENPAGLKDLIDAMPVQVSVIDVLADKTGANEFEGKSWDDLYANEKLENVRVNFPDLYAKLRKEKYPNLKD